jgi:hypothetical protein
LKFDYYDSPYIVFGNTSNAQINKSENPFGSKLEDVEVYNIGEFNTVEMKLYNDLRIIEDNVKMVNAGFKDSKQSRLYYEKVKVSALFG